jgi:hypothetical protein
MLAVNGDVDKEYKIYVYMPSVKTVYVRLNNDGGSNYGRRYVDNNNGSVTTAGDAVVCFYTGGGFGVEMAELSLLTPSSNIKTCLVMRCDLISGTTIRDINVTGYSYNSTANITLLSFLSSSAEFSAGTKISVYARRA